LLPRVSLSIVPPLGPLSGPVFASLLTLLPPTAAEHDMPKNKSHKGILKRMKITKTGLVRHNRAFGKHLRSHKSGKRLRRLRMDKYMSNPEAKRLERLLFRRLRGRDQARATLRRSPNPAERKAAKEAAKAAAAKKD
jgi:large subunit ribosomal protein L35